MSRKRTRTKPSTEINVVPYIDVMLVLLIIFMITTPMLEESVQVDLPSTENNKQVSIPDKEAVLLLSIKKDETLHLSFLGKTTEVDYNLMQKKAQAFFKHNPKSKVFIRADKEVRYEMVTTAMDLLKSSGYNKVGLITKSSN